MDSKRRTFKLYYPDDSEGGYVIYDGIYSKIYDNSSKLLFEVMGRFPPKPITKVDYSWIDEILKEGLEDCRKRFILFIGSRYLVNIKGLSEDNTINILKEFYYKKGGGKIYDSWLKSVINGVKTKKLLPWSLKRVELKDKELFEQIMKVLKNKNI